VSGAPTRKGGEGGSGLGCERRSYTKGRGWSGLGCKRRLAWLVPGAAYRVWLT
jgi:hypothetical protein